jgi:hypothetical protein
MVKRLNKAIRLWMKCSGVYGRNIEEGGKVAPD